MKSWEGRVLFIDVFSNLLRTSGNRRFIWGIVGGVFSGVMYTGLACVALSKIHLSNFGARSLVQFQSDNYIIYHTVIGKWYFLWYGPCVDMRPRWTEKGCPGATARRKYFWWRIISGFEGRGAAALARCLNYLHRDFLQPIIVYENSISSGLDAVLLDREPRIFTTACGKWVVPICEGLGLIYITSSNIRYR